MPCNMPTRYIDALWQGYSREFLWDKSPMAILPLREWPSSWAGLTLWCLSLQYRYNHCVLCYSLRTSRGHTSIMKLRLLCSCLQVQNTWNQWWQMFHGKYLTSKSGLLEARSSSFSTCNSAGYIYCLAEWTITKLQTFYHSKYRSRSPSSTL